MLTTTKCCCCVSLRRGTNTIGVLGIIFSIMGLYQTIQEITVGKAHEDASKEVSAEDREIMNRAKLGAGIVSIILTLIELIFSILLLFGVLWGKPRFLKLWVYYSIVCLVILDITLATLTAFCFVFKSTNYGIAMLVVITIYTPLSLHLIIVVNSYHRQLKGLD